jgi:hypothetical protein
MKNAKIVLLAALVCVSASPAYAKKAPPISALAVQQMQTRDYETSKVVSFPAVMSILQDSGYRILAADRDTGLITATASTKSKLTWAPFVGFGRSKKTPVVSAFIEDRGVGSRVRLNFVMAKAKNGAYGSSWSDEEPILDPTVYRDAFERIDKEVFTRLALSAPTSAPIAQPTAPVTPSSTPAAVSAAPLSVAPANAIATQAPVVGAVPATPAATPAAPADKSGG